MTVLSGCGTERGLLSAGDDRVQVVTTTGILRDLVQNVGGDRVNVVSLIPDRADPHTYEPTLRDVRNVVYADVAFSNYLLLEEHGIIKALDANLRDAHVGHRPGGRHRLPHRNVRGRRRLLRLTRRGVAGSAR